MFLHSIYHDVHIGIYSWQERIYIWQERISTLAGTYLHLAGKYLHLTGTYLHFGRNVFTVGRKAFTIRQEGIYNCLGTNCVSTSTLLLYYTGQQVATSYEHNDQQWITLMAGTGGNTKPNTAKPPNRADSTKLTMFLKVAMSHSLTSTRSSSGLGGAIWLRRT